MEPEGSLPRVHVPVSCPYPQPDQSIPSPPSTTFRISILILTYHLCLGLTSGFFPSVFHNRTLYEPLLSSIRASCPAHLILLDFITRITFDEEYRSLSPTSICSFLHSPVTSSVLRPNIPLSTLFSNTLSQHSSLNVSGHVSHPYKATSKIGCLGYQSINTAMVLVPLFSKDTNSPCCGRVHRDATSVCLCGHLLPSCC